VGDPSEIENLQREAKRGNAEAMQALGVHLLHGLDMERDVEEGVAYLEKAAALAGC